MFKHFTLSILFCTIFTLLLSAQNDSRLTTDRITFREGLTEKVILRFTGQDFIIENNETFGDILLQANADVNVTGLDDVIIRSVDDISLATGAGSGFTRMFINQNGDVGIGTTSPDQKLDILGDLALTDGNGRIEFKDNSILKAFINMGVSDLTIENEVAGVDSDIRLDANGDIEFQTGSDGDTRMLINQAGKVLINETNGNTADAKVMISNNVADGDAHLELFASGGIGEAEILFTSANTVGDGSNGWTITGRTDFAVESRTMRFAWNDTGVLSLNQGTGAASFGLDVKPIFFFGANDLGDASRHWGDCYAEQYLIASDERVKQNIKPLTDLLPTFM